MISSPREIKKPKGPKTLKYSLPEGAITRNWEWVKELNRIKSINMAKSKEKKIEELNEKIAKLEDKIQAEPSYIKEQQLRNKLRILKDELRNVNPSIPEEIQKVKQLVKDFHGRDVRGEEEIADEEKFYDTFAVLGDLVELKIDSLDGEFELNIPFETNRPKVCVDSTGGCLSLEKGNQELDVSDMDNTNQQKIPLGYCTAIAYFTDKHHLEGPKYQKYGTEYEHKFGEEGGTLPVVIYDKWNKKIEFVGGDYTIEAEGIRN